MNTTRSVYLVRGTATETAADRLATLPDEVAGVSIADFTQHEISVDDAILLRAGEAFEFEMQAELERTLAALLGDDTTETEEEEEEEEVE